MLGRRHVPAPTSRLQVARVGRQQFLAGSVKDQWLEYKRRQGVVPHPRHWCPAIVPVIAPVHIDVPFASHHGLNPRWFCDSQVLCREIHRCWWSVHWCNEIPGRSRPGHGR